MPNKIKKKYKPATYPNRLHSPYSTSPKDLRKSLKDKGVFCQTLTRERHEHFHREAEERGEGGGGAAGGESGAEEAGVRGAVRGWLARIQPYIGGEISPQQIAIPHPPWVVISRNNCRDGEVFGKRNSFENAKGGRL
jgi:hypothetical protein